MRTNKILFIGLTTAVITGIVSCGGGVKREQSKVYMPDMAYSRAVETYADNSHIKDAGIYYDATPVAGTIKREGVAAFALAKDFGIDTSNYNASKQIVNPLPALNEKEMAEAKRLYNINCGICHGEKLDGNGPLYKGGEGPYPAKPATLVGDVKYETMPAGQMMYSLTYGKNLMGSYASQLSTKQRWMIIHYVKSMQPGGKPAAVVAATDSTKAK
jgi:mono/diheme cytochrome c family protein